MQIYLDNSATTKPYAEVVDLMAENMTSNFGIRRRFTISDFLRNKLSRKQGHSLQV